MARKITTATPKHTTREEWLVAAVEGLRPLFDEVGATIPAVRVSVGWPGGRGKKNAVIGQCWPSSRSADNVAQVFISPVLGDAAQVLSTLAHEIVHAIDDCKSGHKAAFGKIARAVGLEGKLTATHAGEDLTKKLAEIAKALGAYPHSVIRGDGADGPAKQTTRMLKVECPKSGFVVRMTRKWIEEVGTPECPCHHAPMIEA